MRLKNVIAAYCLSTTKTNMVDIGLSKISQNPYLQCRDVIVWDKLEAWHEGAETFVTAGVCGAGDGCHGAAPEVSLWSAR